MKMYWFCRASSFFFVFFLLFNRFGMSKLNKNSFLQRQINICYNCSEDLPLALKDIFLAIPVTDLSIAFDNNTEIDLVFSIVSKFFDNSVSVTLFNLTTITLQNQYFEYLSGMFSKFYDVTTLFLCNRKLSEHIILEIQFRNLIRRNFILMFYWWSRPLNRYFIRSTHEMMKIVVITNPRLNTYRLYYNQALSHKKHHFEIVNWWNSIDGLFKRPTLPSAKDVFQDFKGKTFRIPVVHKPPWHFVRYNNDSIEVVGGRDDKLLALLAQYLNFKVVYFDPPDRNQGSSSLANGSFEGVLGLIGERKGELFMGDVTLTLERLNVVEFSFLTLADSVAFVTHAPSRLNEALALVRPFHWQVWPAIVITSIVSGPVLYVLIAFSNRCRPRYLIKSHRQLFFNCYWFAITIFLKQTGREPAPTHKCRFFVMILSLSATYIISDMYSANLTSMLAKPGREKAINNLVELNEAMMNRGFKLYVEKLSSSYSLLENGTGLYGRLWNTMVKNQRSYVINSVEEGVKLVSRSEDIVFVAGRETLYFDIQRFGSANFHLSEKLNTAYSAIALQIGCPYLENFNSILISIFEAGILTKMTEDEYEKLGKHPQEIASEDSDLVQNEGESSEGSTSEDEKLQPINIKMLQGAFYVLFTGYTVSGLILLLEITYKIQEFNIGHFQKVTRRKFRRMKRRIRLWFRRLYKKLRTWIRNVLHEAFLETLEYME